VTVRPAMLVGVRVMETAAGWHGGHRERPGSHELKAIRGHPSVRAPDGLVV
jgi:hypothetical protein